MIQLQWHGENTTFRTYSYAQYDAECRNTSLLTPSVIVIEYDKTSSFCQSAKQRKLEYKDSYNEDRIMKKCLTEVLREKRQ